MEVIWKYKVRVIDEDQIVVPRGARIIAASWPLGMSGDTEFWVWARVDPKELKVLLTVRVYGTGHEVSEPQSNYVATLVDRNLGLVWHVFQGAES